MGRFTEEESVKWRNAAKSGHELANHSLFHPCPASYYKADARYTAERYTVANMMREIAVMNTFLFLLDSRTDRTYAFPCVQAATGNGSYADSLKRSKLFRYARGGGDQNAIITDFQHLDLFNVPSYGFSNNPDGAQLIDFVKRVQQKGGLGVIMFHGVGGDYLNVSAQAHRELTRYLKAHEKEIWTGTFLDVLSYVEKNTKTEGIR
jgi:peptidoglycan/xylan/chitin deacetylase (PgdA/CDA1 family)